MLLLAGHSAALAGEEESTSDVEQAGAPAKTPRDPWTTSRVQGRPEPPPPYHAVRAFGELAFEQPVTISEAPGTSRLFVLDLNCRLWSFEPAAASSSEALPQADLAIDLREHLPDATRAYGLAFHPRFEENRFVYLAYVLKDKQPDGTQVARYRMTRDNPPRIDPGSRQLLLTWLGGGHNGACLAFGPDGYLYISSGDGTGPNPPDTHDTGQNIGDLLSSVMRIDVDRAADGLAYAIPADNPFVDLPEARGEVWAYGFRNPWKMSFDRQTGELWLGDVGWELWEMVYRVERGGNYGWSIREGRQSVHPEREQGPTPILPPLVDHAHTEAASVTGGEVYYGSALPELRGAYIYGDYVSGTIWGLRADADGPTWHEVLADSRLQLIDFALDNSGELLILDYDGGIYRLERQPSESTAAFPRRLSETGLFADTAAQQPAAGVVEYRTNATMWQDGARSQRWLAMPRREQLTFQRPEARRFKHLWGLPEGSVVAKTLTLPAERQAGGRRIETQLVHYEAGTFRYYTYAWNDQQTDAVLVPAEGQDRVVEIPDLKSPGGAKQFTWHFASRSECGSCHNPRAGDLLAFDFAHLLGDGSPGATGTLAHWQRLDMLAEAIPAKAQKAPRLVDPFQPASADETATLDLRARSYLHVNCAHCHRVGGGGTATMQLPLEVPLEQAKALDVRPTQGALDVRGAQIIAAGDPYRSVLYHRMARIGPGHMPRLGSSTIDQAGLNLVFRWIASLGGDAEQIARRNAHWQPLLDAVAAANASPGDEQREVAITELLSEPAGAIRLARAIDLEQLPPAVVEQVLVAALAAPASVRDIFERYLSEEQRVRRLGNEVNRQEILALPADAQRGRQVFFESTAAQCKSCHRIEQSGGEVGPELTHVARKNDKAAILESILDPSKRIDPAFISYVVETAAGRLLTGLLVEKSDQRVVLRDAQGKQIRLATADVELLLPQDKSLMPELLVRDLTAQELADLLEYLAGLK